MARPLTLLVACVVLCAACQDEVPTSRVIHLVEQRYQDAGSPSMDRVPTAEVGGERRPVLAASVPVALVSHANREPNQQISLDVEIPEALRGRPLRLAATFGFGSPIRSIMPRVVPRPDSHPLAVVLQRTPPIPQGPVQLSARGAPAPRYLTDPITVPAGAKLRFGIGVDENEWPPGLPGVDFSITAMTDGDEHRLFHSRLDPGTDPATRHWFDHEIDLAPFAGRTLRLRFDTAPDGEGPGVPLVYPVWSDPTIRTPGALDERPNLLLISIDTLRADHLSSYGHARPTSPSIDRFALQGTIFEQASAQFPATDASHLSLITSLYPCVHGRKGTGLPEPGNLRPDAVTLAEILRAAGYSTAAYTEDGYVTAALGFSRGFDTFVENRHKAAAMQPRGEAKQTLHDGLEWIRRRARPPWFLFLHTYQVHGPYTPPPGYVERVAPGQTTDRASDEVLYDAEIRYTDDLLAQFFAALENDGAAARTLVVLTSDHGEAFGEHQQFSHGTSLYEELLHVPLIMWGAGLVPAGNRIAEPVASIDVVPTVLELLGVPASAPMQGRSLVPLLNGGGLPSRTFYAESQPMGLVAARAGGQKWIVETASGHPEAFDLSRDPGEVRDLAPELQPDTGARVLAEFQAECRLLPPPAGGGTDAAFDPAVAEKLRALGYTE